MATEKKTNVGRARELFDHVWNLDGAGLCVTDYDLLAEDIAETFGVEPSDVYGNYEPTEDEDEDDDGE